MIEPKAILVIFIIWGIVFTIAVVGIALNSITLALVGLCGILLWISGSNLYIAYTQRKEHREWRKKVEEDLKWLDERVEFVQQKAKEILEAERGEENGLP